MLSRRDVLIAGAAGLASPALGRLTPLLGDDSFSFAFFSDTHVGVRGNIAENEAMLREIAAWRPDFAVNGGDVTDYGWRTEYDNWRRVAQTLPCRIHCNMGNHDVRWSPLGPKAFAEGTGDPLYHSFEHKGCLFVVLDSTVPLSHWGHFEAEQLRWVEKELQRVGRATPVFLFTHHWVGRDVTQTDNEDALLRLIEPYNVKLVFNGHGHSDLLWTYGGVPGTMNKGLYQGSWQRIDVDRAKGEVRLTRRSAAAERSGLLGAYPLKADREKRPIWPAAIPAGAEVRWNDGKYSTDPAPPTMPGVHEASVRRGNDDYWPGPVITVGKEKPTWRVPLSGGVMSQLRAKGDSIYVTTMDGAAYRVRQSDGKVLWRYAAKGGYAHSSPLLTDQAVEMGRTSRRLPSAVIFGTADGRVHCVAQRDGKPLWSFKTQGPVYGSAVLSGFVVVVPSGDGFIYGLDLFSGKEKWRYELPRSETSFVQSPLAESQGRVFAGAWDKHVYALDGATGRLLWRKNGVGERSFAFSPAIGNPVVEGNRVVVPANGNILWCFDAESGDVLWQTSAEGDKFGYPSPRIAEGRVFVGTLGDKGQGRCVDLETGKILWTVETGSTMYDAGPAVLDSCVVFPSVSGKLTAVEKGDGKIVWQYQQPKGHRLSTPVGVGNALFTAGYDNALSRFDLT